MRKLFSSHPQGMRFPVHRQVSRLGFIRRSAFPADLSASDRAENRHMLLCPLHGCWDSAGLAPASHVRQTFPRLPPRIAAHLCGLFICQEYYTCGCGGCQSAVPRAALFHWGLSGRPQTPSGMQSSFPSLFILQRLWAFRSHPRPFGHAIFFSVICLFCNVWGLSGRTQALRVP